MTAKVNELKHEDSDSDSDSDSSDSELLLDGTLVNVLEQDSLEWIFVGGKGGVGKTTTSCALSMLLASSRANLEQKVLIISTDPAHNLSDAFGQQFGPKPIQVKNIETKNLYAMEIDPKIDFSQFGDEFLQNTNSSTVNFLADLSTSVPGIDEAMSFAELIKQIKKKDFSVIVFDTAPTGHTLRLLSFPSILEKAIHKMDAIRHKFGGMFENFTNLLNSNSANNLGMGQINSNAIANKLTEMKQSIENIKKQFEDSSLTTFVCVCIPEFLSLYETERLIQKLAKFGIDSHNIVVNQVLVVDDNDQCRRCKARVAMQAKYIAQFKDLYQDFHLVHVPLMYEEVRHTTKLKQFGKLLLTDQNQNQNTNANTNTNTNANTIKSDVIDVD